MQPEKFKGQNVIYAENQPEYLPLPALKLPDGTVYTFWTFTQDELQKMIYNKGIYLKQLTFNQPLQPILPLADLGDDLGIVLPDGM